MQILYISRYFILVSVPECVRVFFLEIDVSVEYGQVYKNISAAYYKSVLRAKIIERKYTKLQ